MTLSTLMTHCGMDSSVLVQNLSAAHTPNMPWFIRTLNETTTEDIELSVCGSAPISDEDTPIEVIELFVY